MGFHKITTQDSVKSIISNQSIESNATYTCTCGVDGVKSTGNMTRNDSLHNANEEENSCVQTFHTNENRKMVQQIFLYILGWLKFFFL